MQRQRRVWPSLSPLLRKYKRTSHCAVPSQSNTHHSPLHHSHQARPPAQLAPPPAINHALHSTYCQIHDTDTSVCQTVVLRVEGWTAY